MANSFLVRLTAVPAMGEDMYLATPIDTGARPSHPIALPGDPWWPGKPPGGGGGQPPGIWPNPPEGIAPLPEHPIALPGDPWWPGEPIDPPGHPPSAPSQDCKWVYTEKGWFLVCGPTDKPRPPGR